VKKKLKQAKSLIREAGFIIGEVSLDTRTPIDDFHILNDKIAIPLNRTYLELAKHLSMMKEEKNEV